MSETNCIMKALNILLVVSFFLSCNHQEPEPVYEGEITARINGNTWVATAYAVKNITFQKDKMSLFFVKYDEKTGLTEKCVVSNIPFSPGSYEIVPDPSVSNADTTMIGNFYFEQFHELLASYDILDGTGSFLILEKVDSITKEFRGELNLEFIVDFKEEKGMPDTIRLKNGSFFGSLIN